MSEGRLALSATPFAFVGERSICPTSETLHAFAIGSLSEDGLFAVARHLDSCNDCAASLADMPVADTIIDALRAARASTDEEQQRRVQRVCERVCPAKEEVSTTVHPLSQVVATKDPFVGRVFGRCELVRPIGRGGMGMVYEAIHERLKQSVAVKLLAPGRLEDPKFVARFRREVLALGGIDHPNVVRALDAGEEEGIPFLIMEYVDGVSVSHLIEKLGPLSIPNACEIVRQAAVGLDYIHSQNRVHRDIKPSNLLIDRRGIVKIVDLGLARIRREADDDSITTEHEVFGTADYMSPEQARGARDVDAGSDVYSLGCTLFKLLTGAAPFSDRPNLPAKLFAHERDSVPSLESRQVGFPTELDGIIRRMVAKSRIDRYSTATEAATALAKFTTGNDVGNSIHAAMYRLKGEHISCESERVVAELGSFSYLRNFISGSKQLRVYKTSTPLRLLLLSSALASVGWGIAVTQPTPFHDSATAASQEGKGNGLPTRIWPNSPLSPQWHVDQELDILAIEHTEGAALRLGTTSSGELSFSVRTGPITVGGEIGAFLGRKEIRGITQARGYYQLLGVRALSRNEAELRLIGYQYDPALKDIAQRLPEAIRAPFKIFDCDTTESHVLEIVLRDRELSHVLLDGRMVYAVPRGNLDPTYFDAGGEYGVYASESSATFSETTIDGHRLPLRRALRTN